MLLNWLRNFFKLNTPILDKYRKKLPSMFDREDKLFLVRTNVETHIPNGDAPFLIVACDDGGELKNLSNKWECEFRDKLQWSRKSATNQYVEFPRSDPNSLQLHAEFDINTGMIFIKSNRDIEVVVELWLANGKNF